MHYSYMYRTITSFADKVLAEMMDEDGKYDKVTAKQEVEEHFKVGTFTTHCTVTRHH